MVRASCARLYTLHKATSSEESDSGGWDGVVAVPDVQGPRKGKSG